MMYQHDLQFDVLNILVGFACQLHQRGMKAIHWEAEFQNKIMSNIYNTSWRVRSTLRVFSKQIVLKQQSGVVNLSIISLGAIWTWVVRFTLRPLYLCKEVSLTDWVGSCVRPRGNLTENRTPLDQLLESHSTDWANLLIIIDCRDQVTNLI